VSKDVGIRGHFSKPSGVREQRISGNTNRLLFSRFSVRTCYITGAVITESFRFSPSASRWIRKLHRHLPNSFQFSIHH